MEQTTAVTIRYDMVALAAKSMTTVSTRLRDEGIQQLIEEIDQIRKNYLSDLHDLQSVYSIELQEKMKLLQKLLNPDQ